MIIEIRLLQWAGNRHQEVMHQRCTTLDERGSSVADLFPSWERLSEEAQWLWEPEKMMKME
jgi:hypothetical protein